MKKHICIAAFVIATGCTHKPADTALSVNPQSAANQPQQLPNSGAAGTTPAPAAAAPAPVEPPPSIILKEGSILRIRTTTTLSTKTHETGQKFEGSLAEPLRAGDSLIADKGARVEGVVAESNDGGRVKGRARLSVRVTRLEVKGGGMTPVSTNTYTAVARATKRKDAMKIGIGSGIGAAIGAIAGGGAGAAIGAGAGAGAGTGYVLATHGDPAVIGGEALLSFRLRAPLEVKR